MNPENSIFIVAAKRSPIGRFGGGFKSLSAVDLAQRVVQASLAPDMLSACNLVVAGQVLQAGCGMNGARQVALGCGVSQEVPAFTVNMVCGSGMKAVADLADAITLGHATCGIAIGMESMSQAPYYAHDLRWGRKYGKSELVDSLVRDGLSDPTLDIAMGETAECIADKYQISRADQDAFALLSQQRVAAATTNNFANEIIPIETSTGIINKDEHPRADTTADKLAALRPAFRRDGTVTAGNASGMNDGASVLFLANRETMEEHGWTPLARIVGWAACGCDPRTMGLGPVGAIRDLCRRTGWSLDEVDSFEINEAFAVQTLACLRELDLPVDKVNPRGGAIALGHPIGCSGNRILVTLLHFLKQNGGKRGIASLCIGGGMGIAMAVEMV